MTEPTETGNPSCKITIELPFDDRWDEEKVIRTLLADKWCTALWDVDQKLRDYYKYDEKIYDIRVELEDKLQGKISSQDLKLIYEAFEKISSHLDKVIEDAREIIYESGYEEHWS